MSMLRRSRRRGMVMGAAIASSRAKKNQPQPVAPAAPVAPVQEVSTNDSIEQLKKFADLRDQGILTDAEFEAKKKQLLGL